MKPITPKEALSLSKSAAIPDFVIKVFNDLIVESYTNGKAEVLQEWVVNRVKARTTYEWKDHWLNVEPIFEDAGWKVEYDKPGYNETYPAKFTFRAK